MWQTFKKISSILVFFEKYKLILLIAALTFGALLELLGVTVVFPILANQLINSHSNALLNFENNMHVFALIMAIICLGLARLATYYIINRFSLMLEAKIAIEFMGHLSKKNYLFLMRLNKSDIGKNIIYEVNYFIGNAVTPLLNIFSAFIALLVILTGLLFAHFKFTIFSIIIFGIFYISVYFSGRRYLYKLGLIRFDANEKRNHVIYEFFSNIEHVIVTNRFAYWLKKFDFYAKINAKTQVKSQLMALAPRYIVESLILILLAIMFVFTKRLNLDFEVEGLLVLGFSAMRILPLFQQLYHSLASLNFTKANIDYMTLQVADMKEDEVSIKTPTIFRHSIELSNVHFKFLDSTQPVLSGVTAVLNLGETVLIDGVSGSGKSTFARILAGLIVPDEAIIRIDGKPLRDISAYSPSVSYLGQDNLIYSGTIRQNITNFSEDCEVDEERLRNALKQSCALQFVDALENKCETFIGMGGLSLSGGQVQRLLIARTLYENTIIKIFDEATNSVEVEVEEQIIENLNKRYDEILVFITHNERLKSKFRNSIQIG